MTIQEAYNFIESLKIKTNNHSEIKIYNKFLDILSKLRTREFSTDEMQSLEAELDRFELGSNPEVGFKQIKKELAHFEKYLKETFSLITKSYYTNLGVGLGSSFGILFGVVFLSSMERSMGIALGISFGMLVGVTIGRTLDAKAKSEGRVL